MDILANIFGSELRVKLMKLFLFNTGSIFDIETLTKKTGSKSKILEPELNSLYKMGLVKISKVTKIVEVTVMVKNGKKGKKAKKTKKVLNKKKKLNAYTLDTKFVFIDALSDFLVKTHSIGRKKIIKRIEKTGRIKAVLMAGIFMRDSESRLDLFVVGDNVNSTSLDRVVKTIESDMGKDIRYAFLSAPDFAYRMSMNDRLVRDVLDFPHEVLVDKIGLSRS